MNQPRASLIGLIIAVLLGALLLTPVQAQQGEGYWYTVQPGDSWWSISARTGIPVGVLQANNPQAIRANLWLWVGERIWIPTGTLRQTRGYWYVVQPGDTWLGLALRTGVPVSVLKRLNPHAIRPNDWMWVGDRIFIPLQGAAPPSPATPTPTPRPPTPTPTPTPTEPTPTPTPPRPTPASPTPTATPKPTFTPTPTSTPTSLPIATPTIAAKPLRPPTPTPTLTPTPSPTSPLAVACPTTTEEITTALREVLAQTGGNVGLIREWAQACGLAPEQGTPVASTDVNGDGRTDLVVIANFTDPTTATPQHAVIVFLAQGEAYMPIFRASAPGNAQLLAFRDVNADGQLDLVWQSEVCQPGACYATVRVYTWTGPEKKFVPFTEGEISMPNATVRLEDVTPDNGEEIVLHGGIIRTISAGPQRSWTETWGSEGGSPYRLLARVYDPSDCLYHWVLDGNAALNEGRLEDALRFFQAVVSDENLVPCWLRPNEEEELRTFGWFRLALTYAYAGQPDMVATVVNQAQAAYPDAPYIEALRTWYRTYQETTSPLQACAALQPFVEANPILWEMLADYGYANPTFGPANVCPTVPPEETAVCPRTLEGALTRVRQVLMEQSGDVLALDQAVRACGYAGDAYGGVGAQDVDQDGDEDVFVTLNLFTPTTRGVLAAFHREGETYELAWSVPFSGTVTLLALEDLNLDGWPDVAWQETRCLEDDPSTCQTQAYVYSWTGARYENWVEGQPAGLNARVYFADEAPGQGQELILHEELPSGGAVEDVPARQSIWTSDAGAPYALYDVRYSGTPCARYALHAAEVALTTAPRYGWKRAVDRLRRVLTDNTLTACHPTLDADEELQLIRDIARFHLALAYAYQGNLEQAETTLAPLFDQEMTPVSTLARLWWESYPKAGGKAACARVIEEAQRQPRLLSVLSGYPAGDVPPATVQALCPVLIGP